MASAKVTLAQLIETKVNDYKAAAKFADNSFAVERTYFPTQRLPDVPEDGKLWIISLAADDAIVSRGNLYTSEIPIQLAYQRLLSIKPAEKGKGPQDLTTVIDTLIELEEQFRDAVQDAVIGNENFTWLRNEALKDENETPFSFTGLREANTFETFFTAVYSVQLQRSLA